MDQEPERQPTARSQEFRKGLALFILKLFLALLLLGLVLSKVRLSEAQKVLQQASWGWLPLYLAIFFGNLWIVAWRYYLLLKRQVAFPQVLSTVALQTIMGNLVFNVAGFATFVATMRGKYQVGLGQGVSTLVAARFLDLLVWLPVFLGATWMVWPKVAKVSWLPLSALSIISLVILVAGLALIFRYKFLQGLNGVLNLLGFGRWHWVKRVLLALQTLAEEEPKGWYPQVMPLLAWSLFILLTGSMAYYCNLRTFGVHLSYITVIFVYFLCILPTFIPIVVLGGLGVTDISGLFLFGLFDLPDYTMAPVIIGARFLFYGANLLLFLLYWTLTRWPKPRQRREDPHD